jgi:hypothetical protein
MNDPQIGKMPFTYAFLRVMHSICMPIGQLLTLSAVISRFLELLLQGADPTAVLNDYFLVIRLLFVRSERSPGKHADKPKTKKEPGVAPGLSKFAVRANRPQGDYFGSA